MESLLNDITDIINSYEGGEWQSADNLRGLLRKLSTSYYHLTKHNIEYAQDWNKAIYKFKGSDAAGQRFAELTVPELRITRKILSSCDRVMNSMRSEIAILRNES